jgi:hypothetical protein
VRFPAKASNFKAEHLVLATPEQAALWQTTKAQFPWSQKMQDSQSWLFAALLRTLYRALPVIIRRRQAVVTGLARCIWVPCIWVCWYAFFTILGKVLLDATGARPYVEPVFRVLMTSLLGSLISLLMLRLAIVTLTGWWLWPRFWDAEHLSEAFSPAWQQHPSSERVFHGKNDECLGTAFLIALVGVFWACQVFGVTGVLWIVFELLWRAIWAVSKLLWAIR